MKLISREIDFRKNFALFGDMYDVGTEFTITLITADISVKILLQDQLLKLGTYLRFFVKIV